MQSYRCLARAKLNITLDIVSRRPDGYHDIESIVQTLAFGDEVTIDITRADSRISLEAEGDFLVPAGESNLAHRAAAAFIGEYESSVGAAERIGARIRLLKRIPVESGLGGGSSDAAAVLHLMNEATGRPFGQGALENLAAGLGSDVIYLLQGGLALLEGRGIPTARFEGTGIDRYSFLLAKPQKGLSTAAMYSAWDSRRGSSGLKARQARSRGFISLLSKGNLAGALSNAGNDFDWEAETLLPEVGELKALMIEAGAVASSMSGSGSAVFGIFEDGKDADRTAFRVRDKYGDIFVAVTKADDRRGMPMIW